MKKYMIPLAIALNMIVLLATSPAVASDLSDDVSAIKSLLKNTWDKPDALVDVEPIVVSADAAVAGWAQSGRGGRALLKKHHGQWRVLLCGGNNMMDESVLQEAGLTPLAARSLATAVKQADEHLSPEKLNLFASFEGLVRLDGGHHHGEQEKAQHKH